MNAAVERLGWMLLHSLWEDTVILLLLQAALIGLQRKSAQARYLAACLALAMMAFLPWMTFGSLDLSARLRSDATGSGATLVQDGSGPLPAIPAASQEGAWSPRSVGSFATVTLRESGRSFLDAFLPWLVRAWILGVAVLTCRLWFSWRSVRVLAGLSLPALSPAWQKRLKELCRTADVRTLVRAGETARVVVPLVVGWLKPVILLPLGVLAQLPAEQVEAILLHELAHIRRHDFVVNLLQSVVETLFFYHPAVRLVSRRICEERERVCDDLSVEWCRNPVVYAEALATFEEFRRHSLALAATGEGNLLARVRRIMLGVEAEQRAARLFGVAAFLATGIYLASMFLAPLFAAELMTDKERIAILIASRIQDEGPAETTIFGKLRTEDGQSIPTELQAFSFSDGPNFMSSNSFFFDGNSFSQSIRGRFISLSIWARGYAPLFFDAKVAGGKAGPLSLVLKRGMSARLRLVAPDGTPLAGVSLKGTFSKIGLFASINTPEMLTDANGEVVVKNVEADTLLVLIAEKPGWQFAERVLDNWKPEQVVTWQLKPASPATGTIIDKATQRPVVDADILLASINRGNPVLLPGGSTLLTETTTTTYNATDIPPPPVLAHTDSQGRFQLDTLNDDDTYWIYVRAPGYPMISLPVKSIRPDLKVKLGRGFSVKGKILDPDGVLKAAQRPLEIRAQAYIQTNDSLTTGYTIAVPVMQHGSEMTFSFTGLPKGRMTFRVNYVGPSYDLDLQKNMDNFVVDLSASAQKKAVSPVRTVQILLDPGLGHAPAAGQIGIESQLSPVVNGQVSLSVPTPGDITISPEGLIGYWFLRQDFKVPSGDQPFLKRIPLFPAGAIRGKVTADPSVSYQTFTCIAFVVKRAPCLEYGGGGVTAIMGQDPLTPRTRYLTASLPFGGIYAVLLCSNSGANFTVSPAFTIDAEHPIIDCDLHRPAGQTLRGRFLDNKNQPIGLAAIALVYYPPNNVSWNQSANGGMTARDGTFAIPYVNLDVPGYYQVQLYDPKWAQNTVHINSHTRRPVIMIAQPEGR